MIESPSKDQTELTTKLVYSADHKLVISFFLFFWFIQQTINWGYILLFLFLFGVLSKEQNGDAHIFLCF